MMCKNKWRPHQHPAASAVWNDLRSSYGVSSSEESPDSSDMSPDASGAAVWLRDGTEEGRVVVGRVVASAGSTDHCVTTA